MALPNTNISVAMVRDELGAASNDVGQLCIHPNVNKWSKWKPVRYESLSAITEAELRSKKYGFDIPYGFKADSTILSTAWGYLKPRGGSVTPIEPYRLGDFRNYNKLAIMPIEAEIPNEINKVAFNPNLRGKCTITTLADSDFQLNDLFEGFYFGVMAGGYYKTLETPVASNSNIYSLEIQDCPGLVERTTEDVYLFMSTEMLPEWVNLVYSAQYSLSADGTVAYKEGVVISGAPLPNKYFLTVTGLNVRGWSDAVVVAGSISATGTLLTLIPNSLEPVSVTVSAQLNSGGTTITETYTSFTVDPDYIQGGEYQIGAIMGFTVSSDTPYLEPVGDDFYNITYTINYAPI